MNVSKKMLSIIAISSITYATTTPSMQRKASTPPHPRYGFHVPANPNQVHTFTTEKGEVFPVYNGIIIFDTRIAQQTYPKLDLSKVKFTTELGAFSSNGENSGPAQ